MVESKSVTIRHPGRIHLVVFARRDAENFIATGPDRGVAAGAAVEIDALGFLEEPDTHLEAEVIGSQGSHRTNVGGVEGVVIIKATSGVDRHGSVSATLGESEDGFFGHFFHKADAAAAHNTAFVVEADVFANVDVLGLLDLGFLETGLAATVFHRKLLELAFAGLVADRAVERVVDEEEFHDALAGGLDELAGGADSHVFGHGIGASDDGTRHPADFLKPIVIVRGVGARSRTGRHSHLHEAHAAIAGRGKFGMVAVMGDFFADQLGGFDHPSAPGHLNPFSIDLHVDHAFFSGKVLGKLLFGNNRGVFAHGRRGFYCVCPSPAQACGVGTMQV